MASANMDSEIQYDRLFSVIGSIVYESSKAIELKVSKNCVLKNHLGHEFT